MARILFLFLMQAVTESIEKEWRKENRALPSLRHKRIDKDLIQGQLVGQKDCDKTLGEIVEILCLLFVDDGVFTFNSREELAKYTPFLYRAFSRFGLIMHVGTEDSKSKSEALCIPARHG